jgi:hypothetical protein
MIFYQRYAITPIWGIDNSEVRARHTSLAAARRHASDLASHQGVRYVVHDLQKGLIVHDTYKTGRGDQVYHGSSSKGQASWLPKEQP